jgi:streptogramin lyase
LTFVRIVEMRTTPSGVRRFWAVGVAAATACLVAVPSAGARDLYVTEYTTPGVVRVDPSTGQVDPVASGAPLGSASYLTVMANGNLAVTDENRPGLFTVKPGNGHIQLLTDDKLVGPYGLDTGPDGNLIVADYGSTAGTSRVFRIDPKSGHVHTLSRGPWRQYAYGVQVDPHTGTIYVLDSGGAVDRIRSNGSLKKVAAGGVLDNDAWGFARSPNGMLYVTEQGNGSLVSVNPKSRAVHTVATGLGADPYGAVAASNKVVYTTDYSSGTVFRVNVDTGHVSTAASGIVAPIGIDLAPKNP